MGFWFGSRIDYAGIIRDKVISYYNTVEQLYQNSLKSHLTRQDEEQMTTLNVQEHLFGK